MNGFPSTDLLMNGKVFRPAIHQEAKKRFESSKKYPREWRSDFVLWFRAARGAIRDGRWEERQWACLDPAVRKAVLDADGEKGSRARDRDERIRQLLGVNIEADLEDIFALRLPRNDARKKARDTLVAACMLVEGAREGLGHETPDDHYGRFGMAKVASR